MAGRPRQRTIHYQRPHWPKKYDGAMSLSQAVQKCMAAMPNTDDTRLDLSGDHFSETRHRKIDGNRTVLHVAFWTKRQPASTVPHPAPAPEADLDELQPGKNYDFLDSDGSILLDGDHCLLAHSLPSIGPLKGYLSRILARATGQHGVELPSAMSAFKLVNVANPDILSQLKRDPLKTIELNVSQYNETIERAQGTEPNMIQKLRKAMADVLLLEDKDLRQVAQAASNLRHKLSITIGSGSIEPDKDAMLAIATNLLDESGVLFKTRGGSRLTRDEMTVHKRIRLAPYGKTVFHTDVWREMEQYMGELATDRLLQV